MALLTGKVAVITGAGRAHRARRGVVAGEARRQGGRERPRRTLRRHRTVAFAEDVVKEIRSAGGEAVANFESVTDFKAAKRIVDRAVDNFGKLNIVVNNAGILRDRMIFNMSEEDWDAVVTVHLKGSFNVARHAAAYWREQHKAGNVLNGRLINTSSDLGILGNAGQSNYGSAKAAVAAMAIIVDREMSRYGVTANAIAPVARTRLTVDATPQTAGGMAKKEGEWDAFTPAHVAPLVAWLASDDAKDVHGEVFRVGMGNVWLMRGWHTGAKVSKKGSMWGAGGTRHQAQGRAGQGRHQEGEHGRGDGRRRVNF